jgi:ureidoglycolate lyase
MNGLFTGMKAIMDFHQPEIVYIPRTGLPRIHELPLIVATNATLKGYGRLVDDTKNFPIEDVRWPTQGRRPIEQNSGDPGGVAEKLFEYCWKGETLYARHKAAGASHVFDWSDPRETARRTFNGGRDIALIWRAHNHPDGGQLFSPVRRHSHVVLLALPGDDIALEQFVAFRCDGSSSLYIHPNIWHASPVPLDDKGEFFSRHGRVHASVSIDFVKEFDRYVGVPLRRP